MAERDQAISIGARVIREFGMHITCTEELAGKELHAVVAVGTKSE